MAPDARGYETLDWREAVKDSICTWRELQKYVAKLADRYIEENGKPPMLVHLPKELREKFHDRFHGGDMFLHEDANGERCMLHIANPISVS